MDKIPTHKISEIFHGEIVSLLHVSENTQVPAIDYAHRDDYYMFIFMEEGQGKFLIDFEEYEYKQKT
jgi:hypothetical protein